MEREELLVSEVEMVNSYREMLSEKAFRKD